MGKGERKKGNKAEIKSRSSPRTVPIRWEGQRRDGRIRGVSCPLGGSGQKEKKSLKILHLLTSQDPKLDSWCVQIYILNTIESIPLPRPQPQHLSGRMGLSFGSLKGKFPQTTMWNGWVEANFRNPTVIFFLQIWIIRLRELIKMQKKIMSPSLDGTMPESVISQENNSPLTLYIEFHNFNFFLDIKSPVDQV